MTLRSSFAESNESDTAQKPLVWASAQGDDKIDLASAQRRLGTETWMPLMRQEPTYTDLLSGFRSHSDSHGFRSPIVNQGSDDSTLKKQFQDQEGKFSLLSGHCQWSMIPSSPTVSMREDSLKMPTQAGEPAYKKYGDVGYAGVGGYPLLQTIGVEQHSGNWLMPLLPSSHLETQSHPLGIEAQPASPFHQAVKSKGEGNCKLFGIHLDSKPLPSEPLQSHANTTNELEGYNQPVVKQPQSVEPDQQTDPSKGAKAVDTALAGNDQEKPFQSCIQVSRDGQSKPLGGSTRSCTKVFPFNLSLLQIK